MYTYITIVFKKKIYLFNILRLGSGCRIPINGWSRSLERLLCERNCSSEANSGTVSTTGDIQEFSMRQFNQLLFGCQWFPTLTKHKERTIRPTVTQIERHIQEGIAVIPKSTDPDRIKENCNLLEWELTDEEMNNLNGLNYNKRYYIESEPLKKHKQYPLNRLNYEYIQATGNKASHTVFLYWRSIISRMIFLNSITHPSASV